MAHDENAQDRRNADPEMMPLIYAALDASSSGVIITDNTQPDNPIIYSNKAFHDITGYSQNEVLGHNCRFLQGEERMQDVRKEIREAIANGRSITVEIRNYKKSGDLFWNELFISPLRDREGRVTHFIGVQNDVSTRKGFEEKLVYERMQVEQKIEERTERLKMNEEYLNSIIQTIRESLVVLDPNFSVLTVNESFLRTFKVTMSDTVGKSFFDLGNGQWNIPDLRKLLHTILPTNNPVLDFEVEHDFPHIGKKIMLLNAHRVEFEGHYKDRILLAIEDITDRRSIERRKDDFLTIASHELKTPLTTIKGYIQLIKRFVQKENNKLIEIVDKSDLQVERLSKLITELLDVSKIQSGKLDIHHAKFDFDKMVAASIENIQLSNADYDIVLSGSTGILYNGDESHLSQVIENLVNNAVKYSPSNKTIKIHLSVFNKQIKVLVSDSGIGIEAKDQKQIFERFYRAEDVTKKISGMGIGLYICEQIVSQHGGEIWVDSEINKGSTFSFMLPINELHNE